MRQIRLGRPDAAGLNLTPMIDMIFLLVIFFLCVSQQQQVESHQEVNLPLARPRRVRQQENRHETILVLNVLADGNLLVGGRALPISELPRLLSARRETEPGLEVWIRGDRQAPYGAVEPILAACTGAGIWNVAFKVVPTRELEAAQ